MAALEGIEFAVERKDNRNLVLQIISFQGWAPKLDMDSIDRHATQTAWDDRGMIVQVQQELPCFDSIMDFGRGRRQVEKNEAAIQEAPH